MNNNFTKEEAQYSDLNYLDMYDVRITPEHARTLLFVIARIKPQELLVGEALALNLLVKQMEEIANE